MLFRRHLTAANGYLWMGEESMINDFPYDNGGPCANLTVFILHTFSFTLYFNVLFSASQLTSLQKKKVVKCCW